MSSVLLLHAVSSSPDCSFEYDTDYWIAHQGPTTHANSPQNCCLFCRARTPFFVFNKRNGKCYCKPNQGDKRKSVGNIAGACPSWDKSPLIVGHNDNSNSFDDYRKCHANGIKKISGRGGKHLDQLAFTYRDHNKNEGCDKEQKHGGGGGRDQGTFYLGADERISRISMATGKGHFYSIKFQTNKGRSRTFGGTSRNWNHIWAIPSRSEVKAFFGFTGNEIFKLGFYIGPPPRSGGCKASSVHGKWAYVFTPGSPVDETFKYGTAKTDGHTQTKQWSESVTTTVAQKWSLWGQEGSITISGQIAHATSSSYSHTFSTTTEQEWTVHFNEHAVGKAVWQFQFTTRDSCTHVVDTRVKEYAITENRIRPPCCVPGYSTDAPKYRTCTSKEAMVPDGARHGCKVANFFRGGGGTVVVHGR